MKKKSHQEHPETEQKKKRSRLRRGTDRFFEKLNRFNPFLKDILISLLIIGAALIVYALIRRLTHWYIGAGLFLLIAGPCSVRLTAAILNACGYRKYRIEHNGKKISRESYIREKTKAQSDFEQRYESYGDMHRDH